MTDDRDWQSPSGPTAQPAQSPYGAPAPTPTPGYSAPPQAGNGPGQPSPQAPPAPQGWAPPPKPGLIPLRPLSFGTILGSSFRVIRRNPAPTFGLSVLLYGFITIIYVGIFGLVFALLISRVGSASDSDAGTIFAGSIGLIALTALIPVGLTIIAGGILQGIISLEVSRATLGEKLRIRGLWRLARGRFGPLIVWSLLLTIALIIYIVIASLIIGVLVGGVGSAAVGSGSASSAIGATLGILAIAVVLGLGFAAVASWLGTKLALVPSAIMLERMTMREAIVRSWELTNRNFWRTFGTQLLISLIINTASQVVTFPLSLIGGIVIGLTNPTGDPTGSIVAGVILYIVIGIVTVVVGAVGLVTQTSALTLVYIDIRMRKEGLDLELLHYIEAKNAGTTGVANPYVRDSAVSSAAATGSPWA